MKFDSSHSPQHDLRAMAVAADKLRAQGDLDNAVRIYERLCKQEPDQVLWITLLADALIQQRQAGSALQVITSRLKVDQIRAHPSLTVVQGKALLALGRKAESLHAFQELVESHPQWAEGWHNLACCLLEFNRGEEASIRFRRALELDPSHAQAALGLARLFKADESAENARVVLESALEHNNDRQCLAELIAVLLRLGQSARAVELALQLCESETASLEDRMLLARAYFLNDDLEAYISTLDSLPGLQWKSVSTESIAIGTMAESGQLERARDRLVALLQRNPSDMNARLVLARDLLSKGQWREGWRQYAHRLRLAANQLHFGIESNWDGQPLVGKSVLVIGEQGFGDVCYFSRFLAPLIEANPATYMICEPRMVSLLESSIPNLYVFSDSKLIDLLPKPLVRIPLGSLPLLYGNEEEDIVSQYRPLCPRSVDVQCWQNRLDADATHPHRIGISLLAGRPSDEYQRRKRSLPISAVLQQLAGLPLTLVDLQHLGHPPTFRKEAEALGLQVLQYSQLTDDLGQLAAMMSCLDGVLTAQQTNAHLCGALGRKGIVILPPACHFVYGNKESSVWYPSLQLIRSGGWDDWGCIQLQLPQALQALLA